MNSPYDSQPPEQPTEDFAPTPGTVTGVAPEPAKAGGGIKGVFGRPWRGQEKLWMVFWVYGIVGGIILQILMGLLTGIGGFVGIGLAALLLIPYGIWSCVSLWRCAWNASAKIWGIIVRVLVVISIPGYLFTIVSLFGVAALGGAASMSEVPAAPVTAPTMDQPMSAAPAPTAPEAPVNTAPMGAPIDSMAAPVAAPAAPAPAPAMDACEQRMTDFAVQNKADPKAYIAQNQTYLAQCRAALAGQAKP